MGPLSQNYNNTRITDLGEPLCMSHEGNYVPKFLIILISLQITVTLQVYGLLRAVCFIAFSVKL